MQKLRTTIKLQPSNFTQEFGVSSVYQVALERFKNCLRNDLLYVELDVKHRPHQPNQQIKCLQCSNLTTEIL